MSFDRSFIPVVAVALFTCCSTPDNSKNSDVAEVKAVMGCKPVLTDDKAWYTSGKTEPLFEGLDGIHYPITARNKRTQRYFDQGLMLAYGFNHAEAARSFWQATREDSTCAMAWWGFAYVLGPNYNAGMEPDSYQRAYAAVQKAQALKASCTEKERGLIDAMALRYAQEPPKDRSALDQAYSQALRKLTAAYPDDADLAALFAESLMDQHPWDLWEHDGTAKAWTPEIVAALERSMKTWPDHPGAHHFYIHAVEASRDPERALPSADLLRHRVPGSGHLVHMPSHIYMRTGRYHEGVLANQRSISVDSGYTAACHAEGVYPLAYFPHNIHFLSACATLEGNGAVAWESAVLLREILAGPLLKEAGWETLQHYWAYPLFVAVKLGMWDELRAHAAPDSALRYPLAIWHFAEGMTALHDRDLVAVNGHLSEIHRLEQDSAVIALKIAGINSALDVVKIAGKVLEGELLAAGKDYDAAIARLTEATELEDGLNYQEPPDWSFPVRHNLGAVQMDAGRFNDAITTYEEDLAVWKENGWALIGLQHALEAAQRSAEADGVRQRFEKAWAHADRTITSSRIL